MSDDVPALGDALPLVPTDARSDDVPALGDTLPLVPTDPRSDDVTALGDAPPLVPTDPRSDDVPALGDALPLVPTDPRWLAVAFGDLDAIHADHLHCERKAAQSALSLIRSYPERTELVAQMARLAHDETRHVVQVSQLMARRGQPAAYDFGDDYAAALREHIRRAEPERLLDRLLVFAVIEARSAERLALLADALEDSAARALYASLATAEVRHRDIFLSLARDLAPGVWRERAAELAALEAEIFVDRALTARIHG